MSMLPGVAVMVLASLSSLMEGCAREIAQPASGQAPTPVITYMAKDYAFEGPETISAGLTTVRLINQGPDLHHVGLLKLEEGKAVEDLPQQFPGSTSLLPKWVKPMGGPNAITAGDEAVVTINLEPGRYVLICEIPDREMTPHIMRGMQKTITVSTPIEARDHSPTADAEVKLIDFGFVSSEPITVGRHTIRVRNEGNQPHELVLVQLQPGASAKDIVAALEPGASGPPPGKPLGGLTPLHTGGEGTFTAEFDPGNYAFICFQLDPSTGAPHFSKGMMTDFSVH